MSNQVKRCAFRRRWKHIPSSIKRPIQNILGCPIHLLFDSLTPCLFCPMFHLPHTKALGVCIHTLAPTCTTVNQHLPDGGRVVLCVGRGAPLSTYYLSTSNVLLPYFFHMYEQNLICFNENFILEVLMCSTLLILSSRARLIYREVLI